MRHSPLNAALGDGQKSSLFSSSSFSLSIRFSKSAIWYCRFKFLNISSRKTCQFSWVASLCGGEFHWLKVWQRQVERGFGFCCHFVALGFSGLKATLSLKDRISWL